MFWVKHVFEGSSYREQRSTKGYHKATISSPLLTSISKSPSKWLIRSFCLFIISVLYLEKHQFYWTSSRFLYHAVCTASSFLLTDSVCDAPVCFLDNIRCTDGHLQLAGSPRHWTQRPIVPQQHLPVPLHQRSSEGWELLQLRSAPLRVKIMIQVRKITEYLYTFRIQVNKIADTS